MSYIEPSTDSQDFSCPHCGAHAAQTWFNVFARQENSEGRTPFIPAKLDDLKWAEIPAEYAAGLEKWARRVISKEVFLEEARTDTFKLPQVNNLHLSQCFSCSKLAIWLHRSIVHPGRRAGAAPNPDLRQDIKDDIEEARSIIDASPRGAAALLRLAVQKLCVQLGEPGNKIDVDIQSLVDKGMDPHLQQAFDAVRVVGNEAVHPGELDLKDDRETAITLIDLINIAAQELITNKKTIAAIYARLPASKLAGIEARAKGAARKTGGG